MFELPESCDLVCVMPRVVALSMQVIWVTIKLPSGWPLIVRRHRLLTTQTYVLIRPSHGNRADAVVYLAPGADVVNEAASDEARFSMCHSATALPYRHPASAAIPLRVISKTGTEIPSSELQAPGELGVCPRPLGHEVQSSWVALMRQTSQLPILLIMLLGELI